ncbi:MAG TPA: glycosyltransferase family 4 protein [Thermodesulfobacteriota bacterium]|nr:glycosyltransferase family 4 protein [Thermodesulfobacteriota bacterium]
MKILQVSTYDLQGGAAIAAYRLHRGLRAMGEDCRMLVRHKSSADETVLRVLSQDQPVPEDEDFFLRTVIQSQHIDSHRTEISNTLFTLPYPGDDLAGSTLFREADLVNLHWVAGYQSPITVQKLWQQGEPVVWTLHDQWAFTGGCHYSAGCLKYRSDCLSCPQLADDPWDVPAAVLRDKLTLWARANLTIVTPSRWLAACARESALFRELRIEVIPNSLDTEFFTPFPKEDAKRDLGLPPDAATLLFGAEEGSEKRKGFRELLAAMHHALAMPEFRSLLERERLKILCFGHPDPTLRDEGLPVVALGYLESPERIRTAYSAADQFILPSLEDNLPNTMLEALSCGTPVVAFAAGGIPEVVFDGVNGRLAPVGDSQELARSISSLIFRPEESKSMGRNGRRLMVEEYSPPIQARRYKRLYQDLCEGHEPRKAPIPGKEAVDIPPTEVAGSADILRVPLETALGPHLQAILNPVLFRALKRYAPSLYRQWLDAEADRAARLEVIHRFGQRIDELNRQVNDLNGPMGEWQRNFLRILRKLHLLPSPRWKGAPAQTVGNSEAPLNPESPKKRAT